MLINKVKYSLTLLGTVLAMAMTVAGLRNEDDSVTLAGGSTIRGRIMQTIYDNRTFVAFKGIPYAEPPVGHLRFKVSIKTFFK